MRHRRTTSTSVIDGVAMQTTYSRRQSRHVRALNARCHCNVAQNAGLFKRFVRGGGAWGQTHVVRKRLQGERAMI